MSNVTGHGNGTDAGRAQRVAAQQEGGQVPQVPRPHQGLDPQVGDLIAVVEVQRSDLMELPQFGEPARVAVVELVEPQLLDRGGHQDFRRVGEEWVGVVESDGGDKPAAEDLPVDPLELGQLVQPLDVVNPTQVLGPGVDASRLGVVRTHAGLADLEAYELRPVRLPLIFQPVGVDQTWRIVLGMSAHVNRDLSTSAHSQVGSACDSLVLGFSSMCSSK